MRRNDTNIAHRILGRELRGGSVWSRAHNRARSIRHLEDLRIARYRARQDAWIRGPNGVYYPRGTNFRRGRGRGRGSNTRRGRGRG